MSIEWIEYKGKQILYTSYEGLIDDVASRKQLELQMKTIAQAKEPVLLLVNLSGTVMSPENAKYTKEQLILLGSKVKKSALTGVTGFKPVIVDGIGRAVGTLNQAIFATIDEAKEWLVS